MAEKRHKFNPSTVYFGKIDLDRIVVVKDVSRVREDDLRDYLEEVCNCNVKDFYHHDGVPEVALVKFDKPIDDLPKCQKNASRRKLNKQHISIEPVFPPDGIVITNIPSTLDSESLRMYFRKPNSGIGSRLSPSLDLYTDIVIVTFKNPSKVLEDVLSRRHSPYGYSIDVEPYYRNFHEEVVTYMCGGKTNNNISSSYSSDSEGLGDADEESDNGSSNWRGHTSSEEQSDNHSGSLNRSKRSRKPRHTWKDADISSSENSATDTDGSSDDFPKHRDKEPESENSSDDKSSVYKGKSKSKKTTLYSRTGKRRSDIRSGADCTMNLDLDDICEDREDKRIVARILENTIGQQFIKELEKRYHCSINIEFIKVEDKKGRPAYKPKPSSANTSQSTEPRPKKHFTPKKCSNVVGNTTITVKTGDITKERANVLVNVIGQDLECRGNRISTSFVQAGGHRLLLMLDKSVSKYSGNGIIKTGNGSLPCSSLYTAILEPYSDQRSEKKYTETIETCFTEGINDGIQSIAFPVIGCGQAFKYSKKFVTETLISQALQAAKDPSNGSITEITIVSFDERIYDDLETNFQKQTNSSSSGAGTSTPQTTTNDDKTDSPSSIRRIYKKKTVSCKIKFTGKKSDVDDIKEEFKDVLLHEKTLESSSSKCLPLRVKGHIFDRAQKAKFVRVIDEGNGRFNLRGHKETVAALRVEILPIVQTPNPLKMGGSVKCPPYFWNMIAHEYPQSPPYWTKLECDTELKQLFRRNLARRRFHKVAVDKNIDEAIRTLVKKTWREDVVGQGKDAVNLTHKNIKIKKVERIENLDVFNKYAVKRQEHFRMLADEDHEKLLSLDELSGHDVKTKGNILTQKYLPAILKQDIFPEINEYYFFHGTKPDVIETAMRKGLDCRLGSDKAMLGTGIYAAESSTKADQYSDSKTNRTPGDKQMLLVRMLLGKMYVCSDLNPPKYRRPPCMNGKCRRDNCTGGHELFDSVIGDGHWLFREFVVYSPDQCYPEYLITYIRE